MRILVCDDPRIAGFIVHGLRDEGHVADVASHGGEAVTLGLANAYDAVVVGLVLPDRSGLAVAKDLRRAGYERAILLLTPTDGAEVEQATREAGADGCLAKPFRFDALLRRLAALSALPRSREAT